MNMIEKRDEAVKAFASTRTQLEKLEEEEKDLEGLGEDERKEVQEQKE